MESSAKKRPVVRLGESPLTQLTGWINQDILYPTVRLTGADPTLNPFLPSIMRQLKDAGILIQLAIPGVTPMDELSALLSLTDQLFIYMPIPNASGYREWTHGDYYDDVMANIELARETGTDTVIVTHIEGLNVSQLPDLYEWAYNAKYPLIISYNPDELSQEEIAYVRRFRRVPNAWVFKRRGWINACYASVEMYVSPWVYYRPAPRYKKGHTAERFQF